MEGKNFQYLVTDITTEILKKMGFEAKIELRESPDGFRESFVCSVSVPKEDSRVLIGSHGANLSALQYIVQMLVREKSETYEPFAIDVNDYWKEKWHLLEMDAAEGAREALATGRPYAFRSMLPYERKILHTILSKNNRVETESIGKGEDRRVVVKPASLV